MYLKKRFLREGALVGYLQPDVDVLDIDIEYGFTLSTSDSVEDDEYQISALEGSDEDDYGTEY